MKIYFVRINRDTIRRNPKAGQTHSFFPGKKRYFVEALMSPNGFIDGENVHIVSRGFDSFIKYEIIDSNLLGRVINGELNDQINKITIEAERLQLRHLPQPAYLYDYESMPVRCQCSHVCDWSELEIPEDHWERDSCPKCFGHINLEFENIKDIEVSL